MLYEMSVLCYYAKYNRLCFPLLESLPSPWPCFPCNGTRVAGNQYTLWLVLANYALRPHWSQQLTDCLPAAGRIRISCATTSASIFVSHPFPAVLWKPSPLVGRDWFIPAKQFLALCVKQPNEANVLTTLSSRSLWFRSNPGLFG